MFQPESTASRVRSTRPLHRRRGFWPAVLTLLLLAVAARTLLKRPAAKVDPLHGDSEDAPQALAALLEKTPAASRLPLLLRDANDSSPGLRYAAVDALGAYKNKSATDALIRAFSDSASTVRLRVLESLDNLDKDAGLHLLTAALHDEDDWVRTAAIAHVGTWSHGTNDGADKRILPSLIDALDDPLPGNVNLVLHSLDKLTGHSWAVKHTDSGAAAAAAAAKYKDWWQQNGAAFHFAPEFLHVAPIAPTRSDAAPESVFPDLDGRIFRQAEQKGRITLINFWGTWCGPCKIEIPALVRLSRDYSGRNVDIVGMALAEDSADALRKWCREHDVTYRQAMSQDDVLAVYGDVHEVPVSVLIDAQGNIRRRWEGERDYATFRAAIEKLLSEAVLPSL